MDQNGEPNVNTGQRVGAGGQLQLVDSVVYLFTQWKMIFGVTLIAAVSAAACTLMVPNVYTARAMIIPGEEDDGGMMGAMMAQMGGLGNLAGGLVGGTVTKADLYTTMMRSETVKDPIIDRFDLMKRYEAKLRSSIYARLDDMVLITTGKKDGVITIAVDNEDPKLAASLANAYVEELARMVTGLNMAGAGSNSAFLEKRIAEARTDLVQAENTLKEFQVRHKAVSVSDQAKATIEGVAKLRAELATNEIQLATLKFKFTDASQEVKTAKATIANLRAQIANLEGASDNGSIPSVSTVPEIGQQYLRIMRDFKIQESVLEMLTKQYEVSKLSQVKDISLFKIIQKAKVPETKSKPRRGFVVLLTAATVFCLMTLAALARYLYTLRPLEEKRRWEELINYFSLTGGSR